MPLEPPGFSHGEIQFGWIGVVFYAALTGLAGIEASRIYPAYQEHWHVQQIMAALPKASGFTEMSVSDIRAEFDRRAQQAKVSTLTGKDLEIARSSGGTAVSAS